MWSLRYHPASKLTRQSVTVLYRLAEDTRLLGQRRKQLITYSNSSSHSKNAARSPSPNSHRATQCGPGATCTERTLTAGSPSLLEGAADKLARPLFRRKTLSSLPRNVSKSAPNRNKISLSSKAACYTNILEKTGRSKLAVHGFAQKTMQKCERPQNCLPTGTVHKRLCDSCLPRTCTLRLPTAHPSHNLPVDGRKKPVP